MKRGRWYRDPVWLGAVGLYVWHRVVGIEAWWLPKDFSNFYFRDLLFLPAMLPPLMALHAWLGWRSTGPPQLGEMLVYGLLWTVICEWTGPFAFGMGVADPWDAVAYFAGGLVAVAIWSHRSYAPRQSASS